MKSSNYILSLIILIIFSFSLNAQQKKHLCSHKFFHYTSEIGDTIDVVHYDIHLEYIDFSAQTIQGYADVKLTPKVNNISSIPLELLDLTVDSVFVEGTEITSFTHVDAIIQIPLSTPVNTGDTLTVSVYYHGHPFHEGWGGFHYSGDYAFNLGVGFVSDPHNLGKAWFPCVDDFKDRATYDCYITVGEGKKAVCGGALISETINKNKSVTYHWQLDKTIPTYLASVAVGEYEAVADSYNGINDTIPILIYTKPADTSDVPGSFSNLKDIMAIFEYYFNPYPWNRVGYVGTAIGAMEHVTNIAYPHFCINGTSTYEWLYTHELSHMWFGDLVTCASAGDMWLNEGWAVFCEIFYTKDLYGEEDFKNSMRNKHADVLRTTHIQDGGYYALYGVPTELTYGSTVYEKGCTVVQTLRGYLGSDLFFDVVKAYLEEFAFNYASSYDMRDFMTSYTGIDMTAFFDAWVFTPGTPHFSVDSFAVQTTGEDFDVFVYPKQKYKGFDYLANSNIVEVTFMDSNWNTFTDTIHFSGKTGCSVKQVPFAPEAVMMDLEEKLCDATTDYFQTVNSTGEYEFPNTFFNIDVEQITDSAFFRVTHNWAPPDSLKTPVPGLRLSDYRYWKIDGIFPEDFIATGRFCYNRNNYLDNTLILSLTDSVVILYRSSPAEDWQSINFTKVGIWMIGNLYVDSLQKGEYTLAVWDTQVGNDETSSKKENKIKVYPNPSHDIFNIEFSIEEESLLEIFNTNGVMIKSIKIKPEQNYIKWKPCGIPEGTYIIQINSGNNKIAGWEKVVYVK